MPFVLSKKLGEYPVGRKISDKSKENFKKAIDAIREKPIIWSDLKEATKLSDGTELPDKTLARLLEYLDYWGLAKKDEKGRWKWYEEVITCESETEYKIAMGHSRKLLKSLPAAIYSETPNSNPRSKMQELQTLKEMAEEHIKTGYPELIPKISDFAKTSSERDRLLGEIRTLVHDSKLGEVEKAGDFDVLQNIYHWSIGFRKWLVLKKHRRNIQQLIAKIPPEKLKQICDLERTSMTLVANELQPVIHAISMQVEHGEPLHGKCQLCPKIKIKSNEPNEGKGAQRTFKPQITKRAF
jgi:DNA-binding transcriptional ArsR family regulator